MKYYVKREQKIGDVQEVTYLDKRGWFISEREDALAFSDEQTAADCIKHERFDPKYARKYLEDCQFSVEEAEV